LFQNICTGKVNSVSARGEKEGEKKGGRGLLTQKLRISPLILLYTMNDRKRKFPFAQVLAKRLCCHVLKEAKIADRAQKEGGKKRMEKKVSRNFL
jgi:hypothetical protein